MPQNPFTSEPNLDGIRKMFGLEPDEPIKCRACEIEKNDERVKQMPVHTCPEKGDNVSDWLTSVKSQVNWPDMSHMK